MNVFLAAPFTDKIDLVTGQVNPAFREQLESLDQGLREQGNTVYSAHKREGWGADLMTPDVCTPLDLAGIEACDVLVAIPGASGGVHIEIGYATALKKPIVQILHTDGAYTPLLQGIRTRTAIARLYFQQSITEVASSLQDAITTVTNGGSAQTQAAPAVA